MTPDLMLQVVEEIGNDVRVEQNMVQFTFEEVPILLVFDPRADRMRLISPIARLDDLKEGELARAMEANFHSVLDCRYAAAQGQVWAAFIHPLSDLSEELLVSAIRQVAISHLTFGNEFVSGALNFPGHGVAPEEKEQPEEEPEAEDPPQEKERKNSVPEEPATPE